MASEPTNSEGLPPQSGGEPPRGEVPDHVETAQRTLAQTVWAAEDGRCEVCERPMSQQVGRIVKRPGALPAPDSLALVCPFCEQGCRSPWARMKFSAEVATLAAQGLGVDKPQAAAWLRQQLEAYGVILEVRPTTVKLWLPGVGIGWVRARAEKPAIMRHFRVYPKSTWTVTVKPQAHSRGLPRPLPRPQTEWHGFDRLESLAKQASRPKGVTMLPMSAVKSLKVTIAVPPDQWPSGVDRVTTPYVKFTFQTPEAVTVTVTVKTKSVRRADQAKRALEAEGQTVGIVVQGRLMPDMTVIDAGILVQPRGAKAAPSA